jgi:hypothetical protein
MGVKFVDRLLELTSKCTPEERRLAVYYLLKDLVGDSTGDLQIVDPEGKLFGRFLAAEQITRERKAELLDRCANLNMDELLPTEPLISAMKANDARAVRRFPAQETP